MIDDRRPLPESIGALAVMAARAYGKRFGLFFGVAAAGFLAQALLSYLSSGDTGLLYAGQIVVDSYLMALVTSAVIADVRGGDERTNGAVAVLALGRWGIVAAATALVDLVTYATSDFLNPPDAASYGFLLPIVVLWGSIGFATVIATIDEKTSPQVLWIASLGRSMTLSFARPNLGRIVALALFAVLPTLVEIVLADVLQQRHVRGWEFFANVPIDSLVVGPLQALFTVFYLDFVRRSGAPRT